MINMVCRDEKVILFLPLRMEMLMEVRSWQGPVELHFPCPSPSAARRTGRPHAGNEIDT